MEQAANPSTGTNDTRRIPGYCTLCRSRCGCVVTVENQKLIKVEPLAGHPTGGALCAKGRAAPEIAHSVLRLSKPLRRTAPKGAADPGWKEIGWDEALDEIAARLETFKRESGPESVAFAVTTPSGTPMVDSFEWVERFVRCYGSPNLLYAMEVCGWHKDYAHAYTFGRGIGVPDHEHAKLIILWGHNPARTWLAQATRVAEARARGAKVVVVDPKPNGSGQQADLWLRIRPGADGALAMGAIRHLIESGTFHRGFVRDWTNAPLLVDEASGRLLRPTGAAATMFRVVDKQGQVRDYDTSKPPAAMEEVEIEASVAITDVDGRPAAASTAFRLLRNQAAPYTIARVAALTWLPEESVAAFYALLENNAEIAYHSWTGVGQHSNATAMERAIAVLYALTGACDAPGGNLWTVPLPARVVNSPSILTAEQRKKALGLERLPVGPPAFGWTPSRDFARAALQGQPYRVRAMMSFGANLIGSQGDVARNLRALRALDFHVHADLFMNPTAENADIVLPVSVPWERDGLKIGFEITQAAAETVHFRPRMLPQHGECRADHEIVFGLAMRLGMADAFSGGSIEAAWNHQLEPLGVTVADLRAQPRGMRFPQAFTHRKFAARLPDGSVKGFETRSRRVELYSEMLLEHGYPALPDHVEPMESPLRDGNPFPYVLTTAKSGWYIHTSYRHIASLRKKSPDPAIEMSGATARANGLADGDWAEVETRQGRAVLKVRVNDALDDRVIVGEFGWWDGCDPLARRRTDTAGEHTSNLNAVLSDADADPVSGSIPLRAVMCRVRPHASRNRGRWAGEREFTVASVRPESQAATLITLAPADGRALPDFSPGQYVRLRLPDATASRSYSLVSPGAGAATLSICVGRNRAPDAASISEKLHRLAPGDRVHFTRAEGLLTPPLDSARPLLFVAGGIGITPFVSLLETLAAAPAAVAGGAIRLFHGCANGRHHPFAQRLAQLRAALPRLQVFTAYSRPEQGDRLGVDYHHAGRLNLASLCEIARERPLVYLCGSPDFLGAMRTQLAQAGIPDFDIMAEAFSSPAPVPERLAARTIAVASTGQRFDWTPASGNLLDAAAAAGVALPSGCRVGQCESCAVKVVAGEVLHLGGLEVEGNTCLTCQAVPLADLTIALV